MPVIVFHPRAYGNYCPVVVVSLRGGRGGLGEVLLLMVEILYGLVRDSLEGDYNVGT